MRDFLLHNWHKFIGTEAPSSIQILPISSCFNNYGKYVVLVFINYECFPSYVMKVTRDPKFSFKLQNEFTALKTLCTSKALKFVIPFPYYIDSHDENLFIIQRGFIGSSLFSKIREARKVHDTYALIFEAIDLLVLINSSKSKEGTGQEDNRETFLEILLENFNRNGVKKKVVEGMKEYYGIFNNSEGNRKYLLHGDYWQTNIMVNRENKVCGIIDWEFSEPGFSIPSDIIWFMINLGYCLYLKQEANATVADSFKWTFFSSGEHNEIIALCFHRYIEKMGLDKKLFLPLLKLTLAKQSMRDFVAIGNYSGMDRECMEMFNYLNENERSIILP